MGGAGRQVSGVKEWGPFGMGPWKGHPKVYCGVCGWPQYHMWVDRDHEPPGVCPEGHTLARVCPRVLEVLMRNCFLRAASGVDNPQPPIEMLRKVTALSWPEIEKMTDTAGNASHTIAELRSMRSVEVDKKSTPL